MQLRNLGCEPAPASGQSHDGRVLSTLDLQQFDALEQVNGSLHIVAFSTAPRDEKTELDWLDERLHDPQHGLFDSRQDHPALPMHLVPGGTGRTCLASIRYCA